MQMTAWKNICIIENSCCQYSSDRFIQSLINKGEKNGLIFDTSSLKLFAKLRYPHESGLVLGIRSGADQQQNKKIVINKNKERVTVFF